MHPKFSAPATYTETEWFNPTEDYLYCDVYEGPEDNPTPYTRFEFHPKSTTRVPSKYDHVIQKTDKNNVIVAGKVPQLQRKGGTAILHPSLDAKLAARELALAEANLAMNAEAIAAQSSVLALARLNQIEEANATKKAHAEAVSSQKPHAPESGRNK